MSETAAPKPPSPFREIAQPFIDLAHASRALWAVNVSSFAEGFVYFGMLGYLAMYWNQYGRLGDQKAGLMAGVLAWGITLSMLFLGGTADRMGVRRTFILAILVMLAGRLVLFLAPGAGLAAGGILTPFTALAAMGILLVVLGYGMYYPATYAAVRQFTTPATASMGFAMLYAVMNLGAWLPTFMSGVRLRHGIRGAYGFYAGASALGLGVLLVMLNRRTAAQASPPPREQGEPPAALPWRQGIRRWMRDHPLADPRFAAFIFCLMPVQTLFVYNWFVLPQYVTRCFPGTWIGLRFEAAANLNSLLIFILCPMVAALTSRAKVYPMMIVGTAVMAAPTFLLALGPTVGGLFGYLVLMTVGEALWQPRFFQYAAELAPEGRTGAYMGVAQFPWFLTKMIVPLYSGTALARWCPVPGTGPMRPGTMWLVFGCVAMLTSLMLVLARGWLGKDFRTGSR